MSKENLTDIENELDDLSIRILELMNDNISCKINIERAVRSGCLDLAKTRYILGNSTSVSTIKVPSENISASATIDSSSSEEGKLHYELQNESYKSSNDAEIKSSYQDPLKWFGILVPTNLRQGQSWFKRALDLSVQSANIHADLNASLDKYNQLIDHKKSLRKKNKPSETHVI